MSSRTTAILLALGMMACTASTEPSAPYATWRLEQFNGGALPAPITIGGTTSFLLADTLDLRAKPGAGSGTGTLVFTMSDGSGHVTRTELVIGYLISKGRIMIDFHCPYRQICPAIYQPLSASLAGSQLLFESGSGGESRLYRLVR